MLSQKYNYSTDTFYSPLPSSGPPLQGRHAQSRQSRWSSNSLKGIIIRNPTKRIRNRILQLRQKHRHQKIIQKRRHRRTYQRSPTVNEFTSQGGVGGLYGISSFTRSRKEMVGGNK